MKNENYYWPVHLQKGVIWISKHLIPRIGRKDIPA